ncbi:hypothetical protein [uncultured Salinicola sp.]|uniref:hypothetical protein n=1 Tax=uncultured Salinicola sp. TaxID=1193542 RepID=UPI00263764AA|nr:hypothetical protein [uncultured Salinicola sp.]|tara:strand:+ start:426 stop:1376 length:951 start_codon:yes stop_codon:yes gene_type:complete
MKGTPLSTLDVGLTRVPVHQNRKPVRSFDAMGIFGDKFRRYMLDYYDTDDIEELAHHLPIEAFRRLDTGKTAKTMLFPKNSLPSDVERELEKDPVLRIIRKIDSSTWRWGYDRGAWNDIVSAMEGLASFDLGSDEFEITLDQTTGRNDYGYSEHSRTYLDGVFGFLVHWKGEHVMTIGFSFAAGRRLLVQQVQNTKRSGNRWLFRLPRNRLEHIIDCFVRSFPKHRIHVADGADYAKRSLDSYLEARNRVAERLKRRNDDVEDRLTDREELEALNEKISHLRHQMERLRALYSDTGRHRQTREWKTNGMRHYAIAA